MTEPTRRNAEEADQFEAYWTSINLPNSGAYAPVKDAAKRAFAAGAASRQGEVDRLKDAIRSVLPHFLDQPQGGVMNHNDYDPYETGPAYLGPQDPVDTLRELVRE